MDALRFTQNLVAFESPSRVSNVPVSDYVEDALQKLAFATERVEYEDARGIRKCNILGKKGEGRGGLGLFAHTDVVPADTWFTDEHGPFEPTVKDKRLYGRGSCDMKGSLACMMAAAARFSASELSEPLYIVATADEEVGYGGATQVAKHSELYREMVDGRTKGIIGEPTRLEVVYAHKGACGFKAISHGRAAHSSTNKGLNANLAMIPFLAEMKALYELTESDPAWHNNEFDPPTPSFNIGINDHTHAINITPPQSVCTVYFRPMPGQDPEPLMQKVQAAAARCGIEIQRTITGPPFRVEPDSPFVREMCQLAGVAEPRTVAYGTDACMFGAMRDMVVFGPGDIAQAHTHDEWIALEQLDRGTDLFARAVRRWCC
jgi:acetylornithine deacetylase